MSKKFKIIGLVGLPRHPEALVTHQLLYFWLRQEGYQVLVEEALNIHLHFPVEKYASLDTIGQTADLAIVVGGDGNMLRCARQLAHHGISIIGVNRGTLGFLTDLTPDNVVGQISEVLQGEYREDARFLLEVSVRRGKKIVASGIAVNEIVIHPSKVAHMIDYEAYINDIRAFSQRADGLIISTPTGSTAYSLSAGGPILVPDLEAFIITPMFPHSLSVRPLVINSGNVIRLKFLAEVPHLEVACDSQVILPVRSNDEILIKRSAYQFNLIHSKEYDYFNNLSIKLGWSKK